MVKKSQSENSHTAPESLLLAREALHAQLVSEIEDITNDPIQINPMMLGPLRGVLALAHSRKLEDLALKGQSSIHLSLDATARYAVYRDYAQYIFQHREKYGQDLTVVDLHGSAFSQRAYTEVFGEPFNRSRPQDEDLAMRAYNLAKLNMTRAKSRLVTFLYLLEQLPADLRGGNNDSNPFTAFRDQLHQMLSKKIQERYMELLIFAVAVGGSVVDDARALVIQTSLHKGKSIMGYLELDGRIPYRLDTELEQQFFASINKHAA